MKYFSTDDLVEYLRSKESLIAFQKVLEKNNIAVESAKRSESSNLENLNYIIIDL